MSASKTPGGSGSGSGGGKGFGPKSASALGDSQNGAIPTAQKPIRCLVIQLTRLGDTLQSLMALRAAKQLYPNLEIHFVARERFAAAARRTPWIESVVALPTDEILGPVLRGEKAEKQAMGDLARWVAPLIQNPWDIVVNWSYSESSSYLTGLIPSRIKLGYTRAADKSFSSADGWSHYIQAIVQSGVQQNIHLTDILTTQLLTALQIHWGDPANDGNAPVTSKSFFQLEIGERDLAWGDFSRKWIALQLGAGHDSKTWSPEYWARLARLILKKHPECSIVLLGGSEDAERARAFMEALDLRGREQRLVLSLVGETDFDLWASVIGRCSWVFAGDTAVVHLASVLGTRVFNLSIGPVRWSETGPYGNGHYVVAANHACAGCGERSRDASKHSCRTELTPEAVYGAWSYASSEWVHRRSITMESHFEQLGFGALVSGIQAYRTRIRNSNDGGGVVYEPMIARPLGLESWLGMVMGHTARAWYCGWVPAVGMEITRQMVGPALLQRLRELDDSSKVLGKICEQATASARDLRARSARLKSERIMGLREREELRDLGRKLMDLDALVDRMGKAHSPLIGLTNMAKVLMHNLKGTGLSDLGQESANCYRQLHEGINILGEWLKHTTRLARPVAIVAQAATHATAPAPVLPVGGPELR
jgi:ADP-heptose:LPS heptosyltransferase